METMQLTKARPVLLGIVLQACGLLAGADFGDRVAGVSVDVPAFPSLSPHISLVTPLPSAGMAAAPAPADPSSGSIPNPSRKGHLAVRGGMGFTLSPTDFLLALEGDFFLTNNFALGPLLQFGIDDDPFIFAPTLNFQGMFDLHGTEIVKPFVQGGVGLAYMDEHHRSGSRDDVGFLFNFGAGVEVFVSDKVSLGNNILFNILPADVLDDHFFFSWQFITVRYEF